MYKRKKVCYYQTNERRKRGKEMLQTIENVNAVVNNFVWGVPAMVCIIGVGLVLSARTGFIQFRKFGYALKNSIGRIFTKSEAKEGSITPFQAVCTALAATVGTGNIAGVAGAIAIGGAGAVFWMWVSALLGMCTKFSEVTLAVHYREKNAEGDYVGGPMYYIKNGLGKKWYWMASVYAILGSLTVLGTGNATQVNTITTSIDSALISYNVIDDAQVGYGESGDRNCDCSTGSGCFTWRSKTYRYRNREAGSIHGSILYHPCNRSSCTECRQSSTCI